MDWFGASARIESRKAADVSEARNVRTRWAFTGFGELKPRGLTGASAASVASPLHAGLGQSLVEEPKWVDREGRELGGIGVVCYGAGVDEKGLCGCDE